MTSKQLLFCKEYLIDLNATKAAIRAGFSERTAKTTAYELMNKPEINEEIGRLFDFRAEKCEISAEQVLREFASVGMSNIQDYMNDDLELNTLSQIPQEKARAIRSIKKTVVDGDFGTKTTIEFTLHDKLAGLNSLAKHLGLFEKDNSQKSEPAKQVIVINGKEVEF